MTVYRDYEQEDKINEIYKKVRESDKERFDEVKKDINKAFKWTEGVNDAYRKIVEQECDGSGEEDGMGKKKRKKKGKVEEE
jgi:hypothetical protein